MREYLEFFGLRDDPFKITPDSNYFFLSESHNEALSSLRFLIDSEEGFAVVIGEPGTGKTLTVRKFIDDLPESVEFAYILFPNLSPEELFEAILEDFRIPSKGETKNRLFAKMRDFLVEKRLSGKKVLIIIDEAQNLPTETLEELRILSNLETSDNKLLQIILLGQPELEDKLASEELRQLRQRITVFVKLRNLSEEEVEAYINYRIAKAGGGNLKVSRKALKMVYENSLGIPRVINILMERAMMAAFVDGRQEIRPSHVKRAIESVGLGTRHRKTPMVLAYLLVGAMLISSVGLYLYVNTVAGSKPVPNREAVGAVSNHAPQTTAKKQKIAVVDTPMLNVRDAPSTSADVIYLLREGDRVEIIEKGPDRWVRIRFPQKNIEGWVNGKYLRI